MMDQQHRDHLRNARLAAPVSAGAPDHVLHVGTPLEDCTTLAALHASLDRAMPGFHDVPDLVLAGEFKGQAFTASTGRFQGRHWRPLRGGRTAALAELRYGRIDRFEDGRIAETWLLPDCAGALIALGLWPAAPPLGADVFPAPSPFAPGGDPQVALARVEAMIAGLMRYDGQSLASMGMRDHWTPDFRWYGPAAIGSFMGHEDYERGHQRPFLTAFPDRVGGNHVARIAEGAYVASGGWPSIRATHLGSGWLGMPATGKPITMRVMDFWRAEGNRLAETWVFIDVGDVLRQFGVDAYARLSEIMGD
jgi:predicted ester cyclase